MKISSTKKFLSLPPFEWKIPGFGILTGPNGSGKSQLLRAILSSIPDPYGLTKPPYCQISDIDFTSDEVELIANDWKLEEMDPVNPIVIFNEQQYINTLSHMFPSYVLVKDPAIISDHSNQSLFKGAKEFLDKNGMEINSENFESYILTKSIKNIRSQLSNSQIGIRFYRYQMDKNQAILDGKTVEDYEKIAGRPPWVIISEIFESVGLKYCFSSPENIKLHGEYHPKIFNESGETIFFKDLSSGEKVLVSVVLWLFHAPDYNIFPKLLLLDEPDAHLHPEMTAKLIRLLYEVLHKQYGVKILLTTHNPTTVALADEDLLFQVDNQSQELIKPINKDKALEVLTEYVPTLSIDYKNHKQIFCESPTDIEYYQAIYNQFIEEHPKSPKFYFISNSAGKGNCDQVYSIVNQIRGSGNLTSYGIVDWDSKNTQKNFTKVHGENERWAIENFIIDPFYVICLLFRMEKFTILEELGLKQSYNEFNIGNESNERLQEISDRFFEKIEASNRTLKAHKDKIKVYYNNDKEVEFPHWFLMEGRHGLEPKIKKAFEGLEQKYPHGNKFQLDLIKIMAKCYPFVPKTTVDFLKELPT